MSAQESQHLDAKTFHAKKSERSTRTVRTSESAESAGTEETALP